MDQEMQTIRHDVSSLWTSSKLTMNHTAGDITMTAFRNLIFELYYSIIHTYFAPQVLGRWVCLFQVNNEKRIV